MECVVNQENCTDCKTALVRGVKYKNAWKCGECGDIRCGCTNGKRYRITTSIDDTVLQTSFCNACYDQIFNNKRSVNAGD